MSHCVVPVRRRPNEGFDRDGDVLLEALGGLVLMASTQTSTVPQAFPKPGTTPVEVHAQLLPAKEAGGDVYDFVWLDAPDEILRRANEELSADNDAGMFVTVFLDTRDGRLRYSNAGHNPPLRVSAGTLSALDGADGVALGVMEGLDYRSAELALEHGDVLFLFTDGVNEAMDPRGQPWGQAAMEAAFASTEGTMAARNESMTAAIRNHAAGAEQSSDIAVLMVRWR